MALIESILIKNFKCFRSSQKIDLAQSSYFIGANNSGKSAVLVAIDCFFNKNKFKNEYINKTEYRARKEGYNKSEIAITFNLNIVPTKALKSWLLENFGEKLTLKHLFTYREISGLVVDEYEIEGETYDYEDLPNKLRDFLEKISVSYLHPQDSVLLLEQAQLKLKNRLLSNWGRSAVISESLKQLQNSWDELRKKANSYLSGGLTNSLQDIWPGCSTIVDLPSSIEDVVGISEILFQGDINSPSVSLTSQGTGAQSTILYQTHFLLDSDKSLHRGFYYPIWLLEEPESFLHADIISKLGNLLNSELWLNNIQMIISTHSPILLATSRKSESISIWNLLDQHNLKKSKIVSQWKSEDIEEIGIIMGDPNFKIYFEASKTTDLIFIEDKRKATKETLIKSNINVTNSLNGVTELRRYFDVMRSLEYIQNHKTYFLVDNDDGKSEFQNVLHQDKLVKGTESGFTKFQFNEKVYIILFPDGFSVEDLFEEFDYFLEGCANKIFNEDYSSPSLLDIPSNLTRVHASIRSKKPDGLKSAKSLIKKHQDIKDTFWIKIEEENLLISKKLRDEIATLIN